MSADFDEQTLRILEMVITWMKNLSENTPPDSDMHKAAFDALQALRWIATPAEKTEVRLQRKAYRSGYQLGEMYERGEERSGQG